MPLVSPGTQIAPEDRRCPHVPKTMAAKAKNPQDHWCDADQTSCCRDCFETIHKNHDWQGTKITRTVNKERKKDPNVKIDDVIKKEKDKKKKK